MATPINPGARSASQNNVEPQSLQKWLRTLPPLAPTRVNDLGAPETSTALAGKNAPTRPFTASATAPQTHRASFIEAASFESVWF